MTLSPTTHEQKIRSSRSRRTSQQVLSQWLPGWLQPATLLIVLGMLGIGAIATAWFLGHGATEAFFAQIQTFQEQPPSWIVPPPVGDFYLVAPTLALFLLVLGVMQVSPRPRPWSRVVVVSLLTVLTARYVLWRSLSTLNLSTPLNGVFSLGLLAMELLMLTSALIQLVLMLRVRDRRPDAAKYAEAIFSGHYAPTVDILIPTYDEPDFILRRTIIGCQAMDYPHKTIYVLDDTRRPHIAALAQELGCLYLIRRTNDYAKAGNLNSALPRTNGELLVVFDADFVPTRNFLTRTLGFFQNPKIALVQTPQSFYNTDPIARNLGLESVLTPEEEVFYRQIQPIRDGVGSVICAGTSFVVRRSALEAAGGFVTDSLSEDYFTGISIAAQGHQVVYLDEKLSAGLAAENIAAHALQRLRWAQGTLQAFFIKANPLTIPGLSPLQRLAHLEGLLHWFTSISRVGYLLMPLAYTFLGVVPIAISSQELLYFFLPFYLLQLATFSWLNYRSRSAVLSDIYSLVLCVPLALTVIQVMFRPFSKGFQVTPKGTVSDRYHFNWRLAFPLLILFGLTALTLGINLCQVWLGEPSLASKGMGIGWAWSIYNLIVLGTGLLILMDIPRPNAYEWFALRRTVKLTAPGLPQPFWGNTTMLSEVGVEIILTQDGFPVLDPHETLAVSLHLLEEDLQLPGILTRTDKNGQTTVRVRFGTLTPDTHRTLIETLFCRPGQWMTRQTPGEFRSLLLLFRTLLTPRILFNRAVDITPIQVGQS